MYGIGFGAGAVENAGVENIAQDFEGVVPLG